MAFSRAGNFESEKRTRLEPTTIQAACLLKAWWQDAVLGFDSILSITLDTENEGSDMEPDDFGGAQRGGAQGTAIEVGLGAGRSKLGKRVEFVMYIH
jgi:hypothetical protein